MRLRITKNLNLQFNATIFFLAVCIISYIFVFFMLSLLRYKAFFSFEWEDLAEVNRLCWNISQGNLVNFLQFLFINGKYYLVHIVPIFFLVSVFYFMVPHINTLFFVVTSALAIAAVPIYAIGVELLKNKKAALSLAIAYLLYAPKNSLNFLDGDSSIFVIPLLLTAFYAALTGKRGWFIFISILVMLCKTETPIYITVLTSYLFLKRKEFDRINGKVYLYIGGLSLCLFFLHIALASILSEESLCTECQELNPKNPIRFFVQNHGFGFLSRVKIQCLVKLFWPVLAFPLFTSQILIGLPSVFLVIITENFVLQRAHYISSLVPAIFIGTIFFIKRTYALTQRVVERYFSGKWKDLNQKQYYAILSFAVFIGCLLSNFGNNVIGGLHSEELDVIKDRRFVDAYNIYDSRYYVMDEEDKIAWRMIGLIPKNPDISVAASGDLLAPLSSRKKILEFLDDRFDYYDVDYILLHNKPMYMGAGHYSWDDARMGKELNHLLKDAHWDTIAIEGDFYLFKKNHNKPIKKEDIRT